MFVYTIAFWAEGGMGRVTFETELPCIEPDELTNLETEIQHKFGFEKPPVIINIIAHGPRQ